MGMSSAVEMIPEDARTSGRTPGQGRLRRADGCAMGDGLCSALLVSVNHDECFSF